MPGAVHVLQKQHSKTKNTEKLFRNRNSGWWKAEVNSWHYPDQMIPKDPPFFWSWPRYTVRKVFKGNVRVDGICAPPADTSRNTHQSRSATCSKMLLCQEESWVGPKIHTQKWSTGSTAHICPLLRKLQVEERGISWFIWNALIVKESIIFLQASSISVEGIQYIPAACSHFSAKILC